MKKIKYLIVSILLLSSVSTFAVEKGDFHLNVTTNLGHHGFINSGFAGKTVGFVPGVTVNMDYLASDYFSFGGWFYFNGKKYNDLYKYRNFGVGVRGNFHLFQLISEKGNTSLDSDAFDLYIPLAIGGGFILKDKNISGSKFRGGAVVGAGIGATYYFVEHIGANLEVGYMESSYAKFGLSFKF